MNGSKFISFFLQACLYLGLLSGLFAIIYLVSHRGLLFSMAFSVLPASLLALGFFLKSPYRSLVVLVIVNYLIMGLGRYLPVPSIGLAVDALFAFTFVSLFIKSSYSTVDWGKAKNDFTVVAGIWLIYCLLEAVNPLSVSFRAWGTSIRLMSLYIFMIAILVPVIFHRYKDLKLFLFLWSVLTLLAVLKAFLQKKFGFDAAEMQWLYVEGKARTHILSSGIRYFSFFTDAANFGSGMGLSMVVFSITGIHVKNIKWKIYFILVGLIAGYGLVISGTRSSMAIPFAGFFCYLILSKNLKVMLLGGASLLLIFSFFYFTTFGQGYAEIRRMRSAFKFNEDASFNVRLENQQKIRTYMADKPFGVGIGLGGGKALVNAPHLFTAQIPTDSWFVVLWEETGAVGLTLYLALFSFLIIKGSYLSMFKIKDPQLKFLMVALISGTFGLIISSSSNEVVAQFPNGITIYISMAFVFMGKQFDKEMEETNKPEIIENGKTT